MLPNDLVALGKSSIAQLGVVSNIFFWRNTNYFGGDTFDKPLLHTWSLSVEEQFYLFFPLLLTFIIGLRASRIHKKVPVALVCMILVSFFLAVWWVKHQPFAAFYLLPTRAWELLCGGLLAVIPESRCMKRFYREVLSVVGLAAILIPIYLYNDSTPFPGLAAVPPCVGTALLIWANGGRSNQGDSRQLSIIGKGISLPPIRFVGLLSYSLYLWHWPVLIYASYWKIEPFTKWESLGLVAGAILISFLSWKYVETPFRKKIYCQTRSRLWGLSVLVAICVVALGLTISNGGLIPSRYVTDYTSIQAHEKDEKDFYQGFKDRWPDKPNDGNLRLIGRSSSGREPNFFVMGDSHAEQLIFLLDELSNEANISGVVTTHGATPPITNWPYRTPFQADNQQEFFDAQLEYVKRHHIKHVILHAFWSSYGEQSSQYLRSSIIQSVKLFEDAGARVSILMGVPFYSNKLIRAVIREQFFGREPSNGIGATLAEHHSKNRFMDGLREELPNVRFVDPSSKFLLGSQDKYAVRKEERLLYRDGNHLTQFGVHTIWENLLRSIIVDIARQNSSTSNELNPGSADRSLGSPESR